MYYCKSSTAITINAVLISRILFSVQAGQITSNNFELLSICNLKYTMAAEESDNVNY